MFQLINFGDSTLTQRKSWAVTNTSDDDSTPRGQDVLNRLSTERLKRDSTPEFNSSYHYEDENVEFDSPESPHIMSSNKHSVDIDNTAFEPSESANGQNDNNLQFCNSLSNSEIEPNLSRRNTYSIDGPIVFEQKTTPAPKRSILKCSKTAKPHRTKTSSRMVQFARLPKTDSKIKLKSQFNSKFSAFTVTDNEINEGDLSQDYRKVSQSDGEEYDDDLDGVQPLDASVSSLMNSPILDHNNVNKSSMRGSRGNKVMSLVNSLEKRIKESPKHSIRASDLLSMNDSKGTSFNDLQNNTNVMQVSTSSRRVNLEEMFEAEDSPKETMNIVNETKSKDIDKSSVQNAENISNFNLTDTEMISSDIQNEDLSENECEYTFTSPLNLKSVQKSSSYNQHEMETSTKTFSISQNIDKDSNISIFENSKKINNIGNNEIKNTSSIHEMNLLNNDIQIELALESDVSTLVKKSTLENHSDIQKNGSELTDNFKNVEKEKCVKESTIQDVENDVSILLEKSTVEDQLDIQKNSSEHIEKFKNVEKEKCIEESIIEDVENNVSILIEKNAVENQLDIQKNVSESIEKSTYAYTGKEKFIAEDQLATQNNDSEPIEKSINIEKEKLNDVEQTSEEVPSMVVKFVSEMFNESTDEHEPTSCQHEDNVVESYVLVDKFLHKSPKKLMNPLTKEYKSIMKAVEKRLGEIHNNQNISSMLNENKTDSINSTSIINDETIMPPLTCLDLNDTENLNLEINDSSSKTKTLTREDNNTEITELSNKSIGNETDKSTSYNDEFTVLMESLPEYDKTEKNIVENNSQSFIKNKTLNLNKLDKSVKNTKNTSINLENKETHPYGIVIYSNSDDKEDDGNQKNTNKNLEPTSDTSFGKPQYESTPWNSSKSTKTLIHINNKQVNETVHDEISVNTDEQMKKSTITSPIPLAEWSQMMKDFNESVKKASISPINITNASSVSKVLFDEPKLDPSITNEECNLNNSNIKNNIVDTTQFLSILTPCSSNDIIKSSNESNQKRRYVLRKYNNLSQKNNLRTSPRSKNSKLQYIEMDYNSNNSESNSSDGELSTKNNSIDTKNTAIANKKSTSDITTKLKPLVSPLLKNPSLTFKTKNDVQDITSHDEHHSDTDSSLSKSRQLFTRTKKLTKKKNNSIVTESTISARDQSEAKNMLNSDNKKFKKSLESSFENKSLLRSNKNYPKRNQNLPLKKTNDTETMNMDDLTSNSESNTNSISLPMATRTKKMTKKKDSSPEITIRRNLRTRELQINSNKTVRKQNIVKINANKEEELLINNEKSSSKSEILKRTLRKNVHNLNIKESEHTVKDINDTSIKPEKNNSSVKTITYKIKKDTGKTEENSQPIKTRITRQSTTLTNSSLLKFDTNDRNTNLIGKNTQKVQKNSQTKISKNLKSNKLFKPKRLLPSQPIKQNNTDSSEYESLSETEEDSLKPEIINNESFKVNKQYNKKNGVQNNSSSSSLPTKRNRKEINETSSLKSTRGLKRAADTSLSQPCTKGPKLDIVSNDASTSNSHILPQYYLSADVKLTRNMSKLIEAQPEISAVTSAGTKKEKPKSLEKTRAKKRELITDDISNESEPSSKKKITRKGAMKDKEIELKKSKSIPSTTKTLNTDDDEPKINTKVKFNKCVIFISIIIYNYRG